MNITTDIRVPRVTSVAISAPRHFGMGTVTRRLTLQTDNGLVVIELFADRMESLRLGPEDPSRACCDEVKTHAVDLIPTHGYRGGAGTTTDRGD